MKQILTFRNRVPKDYFITIGIGESDITYHAGAMHLCLKTCGIEMCNIIQYSSILPSIANKIERPEYIRHGEVAECIIAMSSGTPGIRTSAGIIYGWLYDKITNEKFGGLVCENTGDYEESELIDLLYASLNELYINGFDDKYYLRDIEIYISSFIPSKKYSAAGVALVFQNYEVEIESKS